MSLLVCLHCHSGPSRLQCCQHLNPLLVPTVPRWWMRVRLPSLPFPSSKQGLLKCMSMNLSYFLLLILVAKRKAFYMDWKSLHLIYSPIFQSLMLILGKHTVQINQHLYTFLLLFPLSFCKTNITPVKCNWGQYFFFFKMLPTSRVELQLCMQEMFIYESTNLLWYLTIFSCCAIHIFFKIICFFRGVVTIIYGKKWFIYEYTIFC